MKPQNIYFLGIGGIGMSALARYFLAQGHRVAGYDRVATPLTDELSKAGAAVHYEDSVESIPKEFCDSERTLIIYTPAIPATHSELNYFRDNGFEIKKRSQILGVLSQGRYVMAVAGTHGKTSTSTLLAWLNRCVTGGGNAFLGGISKNFSSNFVVGSGDRLVVEADEFDRSFLQLHPDVAIVTATDADHLDIYGTEEAVREAFAQFVSQIQPEGALILKKGVELNVTNDKIVIYRYSLDDKCDFYAQNIELGEDGHYTYDIVTPTTTIERCRLGIIGRVNVENSIAAVAAMWVAAKRGGEELDEDKLRSALFDFQGVKRRFDIYINTPTQIYIDDYAHHPEELTAAISSIRKAFPVREITAIFQPHLFTRTRDFATEFARALSLSDRVILLPIYPARELPIEGVTSSIIAQNITVPCRLQSLDTLVDVIGNIDTDIVVSFGAGDIDKLCDKIAQTLKNKGVE